MRFTFMLATLVVALAIPARVAAQQASGSQISFPVTSAAIGSSYASTIGPANPRTVRTAGGLNAELWTFDGVAGQCVDTIMQSAELDSALLLFDNPGLAPRIRQDEDSGGGRDAHIQVVLPKTASYFVAAVAGLRGEPSGAYTLTLATCQFESPYDPALGPDGRPWRARWPGTP
ncbi:MAG: hypothetical protein U0893_04170 [Chloroflexota bacterium]